MNPPPNHTPMPTPTPWAHARRAAAIVLVLAAAVRLYAAAALPLIVTNDGIDFITWADQYARLRSAELPPFRTPGYPLFLAAIFLAVGIGPAAILLAQHALAALTCALIALTTARLAEPRWGLAVGALAAIDPWTIGLSSYVLPEPLAAFLFVAAVSLALLAPSSKMSWGLALGLTLALCCLVRPSFQFAVPFIAIGWLVAAAPRPSNPRRRRALPALALAIGLILPLAPWAAHNARRGVYGLAAGAPTYIWHGMSASGRLDESHPVPEPIRQAYDTHVRGRPFDYNAAYGFFNETDAWRSPETRRILWSWIKAGVHADPEGFAAGLLWSACWQLDVFPSRSGVEGGPAQWMMRRLGEPGPSLAATGTPTAELPMPLRALAAEHPAGPLAKLYSWWSAHRPGGVPQLLLLGAALAAGFACLARWWWSAALVVLGTGVFFVAQLPAMLPASHASFPAWMTWYLAPAILIAALRLPPRRLDGP